MAVVIFDPREFKAIRPQFADVPDAQLDYAFDMACEIVDNSERSRVPYNPPAVKTRKVILYALVCHLTELSQRGGGVVGIMTNAAEGSVSAGFSVPTDPSAEWWNQTQCGATAWQLLQGYMMGGRLYNGCFR